MARSNGSLVQLIGVRWQVRGGSMKVVREDNPRCETCRWWVRQDPRLDRGGPPRGQCLLAGRSIDEKPDHPESKAISQEFGALETQADFGCIQWEAKGD